MEYMDAEKASERVKSFISRARDAANKKNYKY